MFFLSPDSFGRKARRTTLFSSAIDQRAVAAKTLVIAIAAAMKWGLAASSAMPLDASTTAAKAARATEASYYLLQRMAVTTETGIRSVDIGTEVTPIKRGKSGIVVRLLDGTEMTVRPAQITQDAAFAQRLADEERERVAANAASARARAEARSDAESARREREVSTAQAYVRQAQIAALAAPAPGSPAPRAWKLTGSALDEKPKVVARVKPLTKDKK